jgi:hypothetical protein
VFAKVGSCLVEKALKFQSKVGFGMAFFDAGQRKPLVCKGAARFARAEREVRAEDFLEGGLFGGELKYKY